MQRNSAESFEKYNTLGKNRIGDDSAAALGKCLKYNTLLTNLDLGYNEIGDDGAAALGECLKFNTSLTKLDLDRNGIGDDGAAALGECLRENTSLTTLNLCLNKISDTSAAALILLWLKCHPSLTIHLNTPEHNYLTIGPTLRSVYVWNKQRLMTLTLNSVNVH